MSKSEQGGSWKRAILLAAVGAAIIAAFLGIATLLLLRGVIPEEISGGGYVLIFAFLGMLLLGLIQPRWKGRRLLLQALAPLGVLLLIYTLLAFSIVPEGPNPSGFLRGLISISLGFYCGSVIKINKSYKNSRKHRKKYTNSNRRV